MRAVVGTAVLALALSSAQAATIFDGDPVDPASGRVYAILPGVPLILPQPDGRFDPPIVVPTMVGDVDLVVRAASLGIGPVMPPPVAAPPVVTSGGLHVAAGSEIPFTVIASTGGPGAGVPLGGSSLDGIPVVIAAFADLDGDGVVGPTRADGSADDAREAQEAEFLAGRQVAMFSGGVAEGTLAVWKGAPASADGLTVVLTAMAYVGPFRPAYFEGNVPDGPGVATSLPMFPRLDPDRVIDGDGAGGPADPGERLGFEWEPAFDDQEEDPVLAPLFALRTDGSNVTIDRAVVAGGAVSRARFLQPAGLGGFSDETEAPLYRGAGGVLLAPRSAVSLADNGAGGGVAAQLVPVDGLDNVTDPAPGAAATVVAGPGLVIAAPDADGDPGRETVSLATAAGVAITIDDGGGTNDSGATSSVAVVMDGVPVESLAVQLTPGSGGGSTTTSLPTTTTITLPATTTTTTTLPATPVVRGALILGQPALARACPASRTLAAVVDAGTGGAPMVSATLAVNGTLVRTLSLSSATLSPELPLPPGPGYDAAFTLDRPDLGVLEVTVQARNAAGDAAPLSFSLPIVSALPPAVAAPTLTPATLAAGVRAVVVATARVSDDCRIRRVRAEADLGRGLRRLGSLRDNGKKGDAVAGDGLFTGRLKLRPAQPGTFAVHVTARNRQRLTGASPPAPLVVQ
jgi:hypothetical protein